MRNKNNKHIGMEIPADIHYKFHYISRFEGRSGNGQIQYLIKQCIKEFEKENGEIQLPDEIKNLDK